jgi:hypothetical protein
MEKIKKRLISIIITLLILIGLSYGITYYMNTKFIDFAFFIGLTVSVIIWFFTSKGGYSSRNLDTSVQGTTGIKTEKQKYEFSPSIALLTSLAYTAFSFVMLLIYYRSYFF